MKKYLKSISILALFFVVSLPFFAQEEIEETPGAAFLEITSDARSASLGGINSSVMPGALSVFGNAASSIFASEKIGVGASLSARKDFSDANLYSVGGYYNLDDKNSISVGFRHFSNPEMELSKGKTFKPTEMAFDLAYTRKLLDGLSLALTARLVNSDMMGTGAGSASSFGGDLGVYYENNLNSFSGGKWNVGLQVSNFGAKLKYNNGEFDLPTRLKAGGSAFLPFSEDHKVLFTANVAYRMLPSDFSTFECGLGAEYNLYKYGFLRAGYHIGDESTGFGNFATLGVGASVKGFKIDAAYWAGAPDQDFKNILFFTLSAAF
ncbi:PorV/PorQ family protein [Bacteroidales bacterium OttesenSCG-928-A17]|nr:PorV/PorQ family protein [Bacteroidales bacterium OttesenSCG-928-A17]